MTDAMAIIVWQVELAMEMLNLESEPFGLILKIKYKNTNFLA